MMAVAITSLILLVASIVCLFPRRTRRIAKWSAPALLLVFLGVSFVLGTSLNDDARALGFKDQADYVEATKAGIKDSVLWASIRDQKEAAATAARKAAEAEAEAKRRAEAEEKERVTREAAAEQERKHAAEVEQKAREAAAAKAAEDAKNAACRGDLKCWGEKYSVRGTVYCKDPVTRLAKNDFEWIDGMLEPKFSHYRWADKAKGVVTYIGDRIKFQNGFGAWTIHTYECDFDTATERALAVRARPGRLPAD